MNKERIAEVKKKRDLPVSVEVNGWVRSKRDAKGFSFIDLNDGSCLHSLQVIAPDTLPEYKESVADLSVGSSISVQGELVESKGREQSVELTAERILVFNNPGGDYPLQKKRHSFEFLRTMPHLRQRTNAIGSVMRLRHSVSYAVHKFFNDRGFFYVQTPVITASDCEGAGEMFRVTTAEMEGDKELFGDKAFLTVSGQLEGEVCASAMGRIYTFGPTFRAENSNTPRHLSEFWMIEPEASFMDLEEDMDLAEEFVRYLVDYALENNPDEIELFSKWIDKGRYNVLKSISDSGFKRITYTDAVEFLKKKSEGFEYKPEWGIDLQTEHEKYLCDVFKGPVIVYDYPESIKPFYMKFNDDINVNDNMKTVRAMDLLVPGSGELIGGSQREDDYNTLLSRMNEKGLDPDEYSWYLDLRRYGSVPHSGFGLGFERFILLLTGMKNIRDVIPFPRYPGHAGF